MINDERKNYKYVLENELKIFWRNTFNKILLIILAIILLLIILINPILNGIIKPKILRSINEDRKINVSIDYVSYNFFTHNLTFENASIKIKKASSANTDSIIIPYCKFTDLNAFNILIGNGLSFDNLILDKPHIFADLSDSVSEKDSSKTNDKNSFEENILEALPDKLKPLSFETIGINSLSISKLFNEKIYYDSVKTIEVKFDNLSVDSSAIEDSLSYKFADNFVFFIGGIKYHFKNDYLVELDSLNISSADSIFIIKNISYQPYMPDNEYFSHRRYSSDRYKIKSPSISLNGINYKRLIWNNDYFVRNIIADKMDLSICTNKTAPLDTNSIPKMPNEIIRSLKEKINIKNIKIKNWTLHVQGKHPHVNRYSEVLFTNTNAEIQNISNMPEYQSEENPCILDASANLMDKAKLSIHINLPLLLKDLSFNYKGNLDSMSVLPLNSQLEPADKVKLSSGKINSVEFIVHVLNSAADVYVKPLYRDLKIKNLKENATEGGVVQSAGTFLANSFVIRHSNPDDDGKLKLGTIIYLKQKNDAFLDLVWTALKTGIGEVVGF